MTDSEVAQLIERIDSLRRELVLRYETQDKALQIQSKEYERRLESLNHEAYQLKQMQATYISREVYENRHEDISQRVSNLELSKATLEGKADQSSVTRAIIISVIGIMIAIAGVAINLIMR